jgi:heme oxygenase
MQSYCESMHDRLRQSTRALHGRVEASVRIDARLGSLDSYEALLLALLGLHRSIDAALSALDWSGTGIDIRQRRKAGRIEADLRDLSVSEAILRDAPLCPLLEPDGCAAGLGWLYVTEGASLGGRIILRKASRRLGIDAARGGRFFAGYGPRTGTMWRACLAALNAVDARSLMADRVEAAAVQMFLTFEAWLALPTGMRVLPAAEETRTILYRTDPPESFQTERV